MCSEQSTNTRSVDGIPIASKAAFNEMMSAGTMRLRKVVASFSPVVRSTIVLPASCLSGAMA